MYKVIGADGQEYGPVAVEVLREWVTQGRANGQTRVLPEGAAEWTTLGNLPEFSSALMTAATPATPTAPAAAAPGPGINLLATVGLVLGILSITVGLCCCYGFPFNLAGIICSAIALTQIARDPAAPQGKGIALAGLILSLLSLLLSLLILVVWGTLAAFPDALRQIHRL